MSQVFPLLDFQAFHRDELPRRLRSGNGALAAQGTDQLGSLAFRLPSGDAYTYRGIDGGIEVTQGDTADTVNYEHIKCHYYQSHRTINPAGIVPLGPEQSLRPGS